jgi:Tol biopolymer transport system component
MRHAPLAVALLLCLPACSSDSENPFAELTPVRAPTAEADLIFTSDSYSARGGAPREIFAVQDDGGGLSRLTFCNTDMRRCDSAEVSPAPDRLRVMVRRVATDTNGDGRLTSVDGESVLFLDLTRGTEAPLVPASQHVSGVDWSPADGVIVYSAQAEGGHDDLFRMDPNGQNNANITSTPAVDERRPRIDPNGRTAIYERIDATGKGKIAAWVDSGRQAVAVTQGGTGDARLTGTPYVVGSDADPDYSPDSLSVVFRRLTATGNGGLGTWDVMTVRTDGSNLRLVASGPLYRGPPDWGPNGIVFPEVDAVAGSQLVVVQPDGSGRRVPVTLGASFSISFPRWLR